MFGQYLFGRDGGNRSCASTAASQPSHLYVPFAAAKDGLCGFDYLKKRTQTEKSVQVRLGGDGGNRNRVRKPLSTSVGGLLSFPRRRADRQAHRFGILLFMTDCKATPPFTFTANRRPSPSRGTPG